MSVKPNNSKIYLAAILGAILMGLAWLTPSTALCALLAWGSAIALAYVALAAGAPYLPLYICGLVMVPIGFNWMPRTISYFGGFGLLPTVSIFALFVTVSAVQFILVAFIYRNLPEQLDKAHFRLPIAWCLSELISIRIFPWQVAHTQIAFSQIVQIADIGGSLLVSFLVIWSSAALVSVCLKYPWKRALPAFLGLAAALIYGQMRIGEFSDVKGATIKVAVVQANISVEEKHNVRMVEANLERYIELTRGLSADLVIWPETVLTEWISTGVTHRSESRHLSSLPQNSALLFGSLAFQQEKGAHPKRYNAAIGLRKSGEVAGFYKKQILMPFGEYVPFSKYLPILKRMAGIEEEFAAGEKFEVLQFENGVKAAPLICYEDVIPGISQIASCAGANILINLTNDAWFGDSAAPLQHHMIASMRSIENRRFLVRSTNTGLTAIVDPLGKTTSRLAPFSEGVLLEEVALLESETFFTRHSASRFWWILLMVSALSIGYKRLRKDRLRRLL